MEWVLLSPQIHSTFGNLGFLHEDGYHVNENCNAALETILHNILTEDKYLRTYRRSIRFGENIKKDLIPLLINAKEDTTIELLVKILVNLTIPVECLLSVEIISQTDFGRHTVFEISNLLAATKAAFTDRRTTRVVIDFLKKNIDNEQKLKLSVEQCTNISNCLILLRNILHIPEDNSSQSPSYNGSNHSVQNQILWNIFSRSIDKLLIKLMVVPDATNWGVTMVQLIALLYKDQHVVTLHKLLNLWLEGSSSDSSEDNESNTSPPDRGSEDSSPLLTSDPTSDSSDTGGSGKSNDEINSENNGWNSTPMNNSSENGNQPYEQPTSVEKNVNVQAKNDPNENTTETQKSDNNKHQGNSEKKNRSEEISQGRLGQKKIQDNSEISDESVENSQCKPGSKTIQGNSEAKSQSDENSQGKTNPKNEKIAVSEPSDCGYGTQIENQESMSTSSNEDEIPTKKPVHQKPHNPKQRQNNKPRPSVLLQDRKRKKVVKRGKANTINVQGLSNKTPTDDDISNIMKEFTVDFLLKGYNSLVQTLHNQILTNMQLEIDTSHFFWLVTYFLKFATQIELDLEHVYSVLSYDIVSYLTAEGVNLCEQFDLAIKFDGNDLKPSIRRLHLVVTAIREFVQAIEAYKKLGHMCKKDQESLLKLQVKMCEMEELRSLLVLLLRHYNPKHHSKQYLQDLIVTNHILLIFLDSTMKMPDHNGTNNMNDHIRQFATPEIMLQYGLLLEDYADNGEFVNDCIFTMMHHVGGDLDALITLFQPKILKTFTSIWKSEYEICDDWSDLIQYVINTFIKKPHTLQSTTNYQLYTENFDDDKVLVKPIPTPVAVKQNIDMEKKSDSSSASNDIWTEDELSLLNWNYMQCSTLPDIIGEIIKLFKEDGIIKTRDSVIRELVKRNIINKYEYEEFQNKEGDCTAKILQDHKKVRDEEIGKLCDQLIQDGKSKFLDWVQKVLLDTCFAKLYVDKKKNNIDAPTPNTDSKLLNFELFKKKAIELPEMSPVSYHSIMSNQSIPLVPWNCEQASICKDLKFLQLLHKLCFHMPVDTGKVFIRIPHFWTADLLYEVSTRISPIDKSKLKFSLDEVVEGDVSPQQNSLLVASAFTSDVTMIETPDNYYQIHKQNHLATMVNFTPMPGSSFNPESEDITKQNLIEVVQKSQEYKMSLETESCAVEKDTISSCMDVEMQRTVRETATPVTTFGSRFQDAPLVLPTIMSVKQDSSNFNLNLAESEYCNHSVWETASVASDLTTYVSDEDEKEVLLPPVIDVSPMLDDRFSSDLENVITRKRPRLQFLQPF